mmetsp:Transcript_943/g.1911  ORF Transcript_943/g.1911 Transcript_943/m.1911 type:complete len:347 (-) Transcript_943:123-1163(-)
MSSTAGPTEIKNRDMLALRNYLIAGDGIRDGMSPTTLMIDLTHSNLIQRHIETRFDKHDELLDVRHKIHQKTGTPAQFQKLQLKCSGQLLLEIEAENEAYDHYKLGYFFGDELMNCGLEVHCIDINPLSGSAGGQYEDVSLVKKYTITDEEYDKRKGTIRDWAREQKKKDPSFTLANHAKNHREKVEAKREFKLGNFPLPYGYVVDSTGKDIVKGDEPDYDDLVRTKESKPSVAADSEFGEASVEGIVVGSRCQVQPGSRRGEVSYVGPVPELDDTTGSCFVGVTFDEPVGKNDGSATSKTTGQKIQYFKAMEGFGSFLRGKNVEVGDFPEEDLFGDDSDSDQDEL